MRQFCFTLAAVLFTVGILAVLLGLFAPGVLAATVFMPVLIGLLFAGLAAFAAGHIQGA